MSDNVFSPRKAKALVPPMRKLKPRAEPCGCPEVVVDHRTQMCTCERCGFSMTAFDFLWRLMNDWQRVESYIRVLKMEEVGLKQRIEELQKEKSSVQASLSRLTQQLRLEKRGHQ